MPEEIKDPENRADAEAPEWAKKLDAKIDACMTRMDSMNVIKDDAATDPENKGEPVETAADKKKADEAAAEEKAKADAAAEAEKEEMKAADARADAAISSGEKLSKADRAKLSPEKLEAYKLSRKALKNQDALEAARADAAANKKALEELRAEMAASKNAIGVLRGHVHISDQDLNQMAELHARADAVHQLFGVDKHAPRFQPGESALAYRKRIAAGLKQHSDKWKDVDLATFDDSVMKIAEQDIYADAAKAASHPAETPAGSLRAIVKKDRTGREITEWVGDKGVWMDQFKAPAQLMVRINKDFD